MHSGQWQGFRVEKRETEHKILACKPYPKANASSGRDIPRKTCPSVNPPDSPGSLTQKKFRVSDEKH